MLVVFHSRTGTTRRVAEAIADSLGAECEEIVDLKRRSGLFGLLGAVRDSVRRRPTPIGEPAKDPAAYDVVVIGTPVWAGRMSSPVRGYLDRHRARLAAVAFFCTSLGDDDRTAMFAEMAELADRAPLAVLAVTAAEEAKGREWDKVRAFEETVTAAISSGGDRTRHTA